MAFEELLSTKRVDVPYSFASIGVYRGARFLYRADRVLSVTAVPRKVLAEGVFHFGHGKPEKATFHTFAGRHFEDLRLVRHQRHEQAMKLDEVAEVMSWRRMPPDGANEHPIREFHCWVDGIDHVADRFIPPSWPHYYWRYSEEPIPHSDLAPIYGGRHITDWHRRDYVMPESFPARQPRPLADFGIDPREVDVEEANAIADALQRSFDHFYAAADGYLLHEISEPRIRVHTSGKPGAKVYLEYSHYVMDHTQPSEDIVVHFRLDDHASARAAADAMAALMGSKVVERGRLDRVDAESLHLDPLATTVAGIAPRLPDLIDRCAMHLPDEAIRHGQRLRSIWKGSEEPVAARYHYVTGRDRGRSKEDARTEEWMAEWRALQASLGRLKASDAPDAWFSRLIMANEAIRQSSSFSTRDEFDDLPEAPAPSAPAIGEILAATAKFATQGGPDMAESWIALRSAESDEDVREALDELLDCGSRTFIETELDARWFKNVVPVLQEALRTTSKRLSI